MGRARKHSPASRPRTARAHTTAHPQTKQWWVLPLLIHDRNYHRFATTAFSCWSRYQLERFIRAIIQLYIRPESRQTLHSASEVQFHGIIDVHAKFINYRALLLLHRYQRLTFPGCSSNWKTQCREPEIWGGNTLGNILSSCVVPTRKCIRLSSPSTKVSFNHSC